MNVTLLASRRWTLVLLTLLCVAATGGEAKRTSRSRATISPTPNGLNSTDALQTATTLTQTATAAAVSAATATTTTKLTVRGATRAPVEKTAYPKKVTSLKKRPTKTPSATNAPSSATATATRATRLPTKGKKKTAAAAASSAGSGADVPAAFGDLPDDDLEFIKELDKQFQLHGDHIKIKVERERDTDNGTSATNGTKNAKRTIDGELGYGYNEHSGYDYARPKFSFYPYSQQDIAANAPGYYPPKTTVDIQPSYSYELKPQTSYEQQPQQPPQHHHHQIDVPAGAAVAEHEHEQEEQSPPQQAHYDEPVIVLRIPGPAKYASHLQALLQQYLEIRAAQYLQILEQAELRKQQHEHEHGHEHEQHEHAQQQQQYQHHQQQQQVQYAAGDYVSHVSGAAEQQHQQQHDYNAEVAYAHQLAPTPQPVLYPDIHDVYQSYKGRHGVQATAVAAAHAGQQQAADYYANVEAYQTPTAAEHAHAQAHQHQQQQVELEQQQQHDDGAAQHHHHHHQQQQQQQVYFTHHEQVPDDHIYQQYYLISMSPDGQTYAEPQPQTAPTEHEPHDAHQHHQHHDAQQQQQPQPQLVYRADAHVQQQIDVTAADEGVEQHAPSISENSPRTTHTKVVFTEQTDGADLSGAYALPSIRPYERLPPTSTPHYHQAYQQQQQQQQQHEYQAEASQSHAVGAAGVVDDVVAITQRPFNYHAHGGGAGASGGGGKGRVRGRVATRKRGATPAKRSDSDTRTDPDTASSRSSVNASSSKRGTARDVTDDAHKSDEQQLQKIREYVRTNFGARMGTSVEYQTRQVLDA